MTTKILRSLSAEQREEFIRRCWMAHDARWFGVTVKEFGWDVTNRLNRAAAREIGRAEIQHVMKVCGLSTVHSVEELIELINDVVDLIIPRSFQMTVDRVGPAEISCRVHKCFAHDNLNKMGALERYECGPFDRARTWLEVLGLKPEPVQPIGRCLAYTDGKCVRNFRLSFTAGG